MFVINQFVISSLFRTIARCLTQISYVDDFVAIYCVVQDRFVVGVVVHNKTIEYVVKNPVILVVVLQIVITRVNYEKTFLSHSIGVLSNKIISEMTCKPSVFSYKFLHSTGNVMVERVNFYDRK